MPLRMRCRRVSRVQRWEPFGGFGEQRTRFDRLFGDLMDGRNKDWAPAVDVVRQKGNLVLRADIPVRATGAPLRILLPVDGPSFGH